MTGNAGALFTRFLRVAVLGALTASVGGVGVLGLPFG